MCHTTPTSATLMNSTSIQPSKYLHLVTVLIIVISTLYYKIPGISKYSKLSPWKADQHRLLHVVITNHPSSLYLWWIKWISFWNFYFQHKGPSFIRRLWRSSYFSFQFCIVVIHQFNFYSTLCNLQYSNNVLSVLWYLLLKLGYTNITLLPLLCHYLNKTLIKTVHLMY